MHGLNTHTWAPTAFWVASRNQYAIVCSANNGDKLDVRAIDANANLAGDGRLERVGGGSADDASAG